MSEGPVHPADAVELPAVEVSAVDASAVDASAVDLAEHSDRELDQALDGVDSGGGDVREVHVHVGPGELPLLIPGRERFASLDDIAATGDARVDAAMALLVDLPDLPTADHVAVYDDEIGRASCRERVLMPV